MSSILNNVVVGLIMLSDFKAAETLIIRSLEFSEVRVLQKIKVIQKEYLQTDLEFLDEVRVLIFGYLYAELVKRILI